MKHKIVAALETFKEDLKDKKITEHIVTDVTNEDGNIRYKEYNKHVQSDRRSD